MNPDTVARAGRLAAAGVFLASFAFAQSTSAPQGTTWPSRWTVTAGVESFWWRDVARTGPPAGASPISWDGQGPVVHVAHDRGARSRLHHFEAAFASAGGFELRSPVRTTTAPGDDGVWRLSGRYEYRRYPWRDLLIDGFDAGIGVEASGDHFSFERHLAPDIDLERRLNDLGTALVIAGRLRRSPRWSLLAAWSNGLTIGRSTQQYRGDRESSLPAWGGGWYTNLEIRGDVRVASRMLLTAAWFTSGEGRHGSHDSFTYGRSRFTMGVGYGS
jgi:hypothetical protein